MPPFSLSQSIILAIHGLATPSLGFLALFVHFSASQSIVLTIYGLATSFLGYLALFDLFPLSQSTVLPIHGLALTFYLACGDWDQSMLVLSAGGSLNIRKEAGFLTLPRQNLFTYHLPGNAPEGDDVGYGIPA